MGILSEKIKEDSKGNISEYFKKNTFDMYQRYKSPDSVCQISSISDIRIGGFYLIIYDDDSNWMKYSNVFICDMRMKKLLYGINFNFIPLEIREQIFNKYLINLEDNTQLSDINFEKCYKELIKYGFEYAIVEYDISNIKKVLEIDISILPEFLYSTYPTNKYDPNTLYSIWMKKLQTRDERHQELIKTIVSDFYQTKDILIESMNVLKGHFKRLQKNQRKI